MTCEGISGCAAQVSELQAVPQGNHKPLWGIYCLGSVFLTDHSQSQVFVRHLENPFLETAKCFGSNEILWYEKDLFVAAVGWRKGRLLWVVA